MSNGENTEDETGRLQGELRAALREAEDQRQRADTAESRIAEIECERDDTRAAVEVLTTERDSARHERDQFKTDLDAARRHHETAERQVDELQREVTDSQGQLEAETGARIEAETDRDRFAERLAAQEVAHAEVTAAFEDLQAQHKVVVQSNDQLTQQLYAETREHTKTREQRDHARTQANNRGAAAVVLGVTTVGSLLGHAVRD